MSITHAEPKRWPLDRPVPPLGAALPSETTVVSADSHWLEPEVWVDKMPAKFRDRAPHGWYDADGTYHLEADGRSLDPPGFPSIASEGLEGARNQVERIKDLDAEGVDKELLFPQRLLGLLRQVPGADGRLETDREYLEACFSAYNQLLADFCSVAPTRLYGNALLKYWDPDGTAAAIKEIKALGFKAMVIPTLPPGVYYNSRSMEPMWDAIEESDIPLSFHIGESFDVRGLGGLATSVMVAFQPFRRIWSLLTFSGILDRHPAMRVVFCEGGIAWVPSALYDADKLYSDYEALMEPKLSRPPSYYWRNNCFATFQMDPHGLSQLDAIGQDNVLWASDYPHAEGTFGYTRDSVREVFELAGEEAGRAIVGGTALKLWGLDS